MTDDLPFPPHPSLRDRVVVVTGGGRGLGREMALTLLRGGCRLAVTSTRTPAELEAVAAEAEAIAGPGRLVAVRADVTDTAACEMVVARTLEAFGAVHVLVNNAGRGLLEISETFITVATKFWEADAEAWLRIIATNVNGPFLMAKAVVPHLVEAGFGRVINVSTSAVTMVRRGYSPYGPSKAALEACSVVWARDLAETGVTVNVLLPGGATDTAFIPGAGTGRSGSDGNLLRPEIMGPPILWLASDLSNGWTGGRYIARLWDGALPPDEAATAARQPAHEAPAIM